MPAEIGIAARVVVASAALGALAGFAWVTLAPRPQLRVSKGHLVDAVGYPETYVASDMILALLCLGAGLLIAAVGCYRYRHPSVGLVAGLLLGGFIGSLLAWRVGLLIAGGGAITAAGYPEGEIVTAPLMLGAKGVLVLWPMAALVWCATVNLSRWNSGRYLGAEERSQQAAIAEPIC